MISKIRHQMNSKRKLLTILAAMTMTLSAHAQFFSNSEVKEKQADDELGHNSLSVKSGCSLITSDFVIDEYTTSKSHAAFEVSGSYEYYWDTGFGLGAYFNYMRTSYTGKYATFSLDNYLFGPQVGYRRRLSDWIYSTNFVLGYGSAPQMVPHSEGFGVRWDTDFNYMISKHVAIGVGVNIMEIFLGGSQDIDGKTYINGIARLGLNASLQYNF